MAPKHPLWDLLAWSLHDTEYRTLPGSLVGVYWMAMLGRTHTEIENCVLTPLGWRVIVTLQTSVEHSTTLVLLSGGLNRARRVGTAIPPLAGTPRGSSPPSQHPLHLAVYNPPEQSAPVQTDPTPVPLEQTPPKTNSTQNILPARTIRTPPPIALIQCQSCTTSHALG